MSISIKDDLYGDLKLYLVQQGGPEAESLVERLTAAHPLSKVRGVSISLLSSNSLADHSNEIEVGDTVKYIGLTFVGYVMEPILLLRKLGNLRPGGFYRVLAIKEVNKEVYLSLFGVDHDLPIRLFEKVKSLDGVKGFDSYRPVIESIYGVDPGPGSPRIKAGDWVEFLGVQSSGYMGPFEDPSKVLKAGDKYHVKKTSSDGIHLIVELVGFLDQEFELSYFRRYKS